jgi:malate dehydrogenase (oxaloacetate-decarboxylating)(NADP+)
MVRLLQETLTKKNTFMNDQPPIKRARPTFTDQEALLFHSEGRPGKLEIVPTKPMATQRDLSLAYSPGVAVPVLAIAEDPSKAYDYTARANLVAVISNGTAILGLGNLGALASKPVMEGKAVLFKRFADVDSIDLEVDTEDADKFINACAISARPSAASIWRTSRRRNASSSSSACAN